MDIDVELRPTGHYTSKGEKYEVWMDGEILAAGTSPEFQVCRILKDRGMAGNVRFWRQGRSTHDLLIPIERGSGMSVTEGQKGMGFVKWHPFVRPEQLEDAA